ncbi:MAG: 3-deoxy-D-manno-octulosonic acid transferase [Deltaproteobacteria bacterium]|nr:3-deoxy-D-manno-octulosonic acid transferase [Deltaproteobacteria bacterium]
MSLPLIPFAKGSRIYERLGIGLPSEDRLSRGSIWIHALSVGEVVSSLPLIRALKRKYPEKDIVVSVTTSQGMEIARNELKAEVKKLITMPIDFWWSIHRMVVFTNPSLFVLVETDIWPGLIFHLKQRGVKAILVNGRISPRTLNRYRSFRAFIRSVLSSFESCLMQSDLDRDRLLEIGLSEDSVKTVGNIKFDRDWMPMCEKEHKQWLDIFSFSTEDALWVAGSTHRGEEDVILDVFLRLRKFFPALRLIIAPREIDRAVEVERIVTGKGLSAILRKDLPLKRKPCDVLILDTLGELGRIYGIAQISFVGGSLEPIGGHNLLEPASFGKPVLFGPYTHNFVQMSQLIVEAGGGRDVADGEALFETMQEILSDPKLSDSMGRRAREFVELNKGALGRVMEYIDNYLT